MLELDRVVRAFGDVTAVDHLTLRVGAGEVVGLLGHNGAGKTTTVRPGMGLLGALVYAVVANLAVGLQVGHLVLPTREFAVMALWVGPTFAAASLGAVSLVSARTKTTQEAFQLGGVVVLPVVVLLISQATGALLLSVWLLVGAGVVALVVAAGLVAVAARSLSRTRLGVRLG